VTVSDYAAWEAYLADSERRFAEPDTTECVDCGTETLPTDGFRHSEWYIVADEVWADAGITKLGGCLCIGCLEERIGRQLTAADFPDDIPVNDLAITDGRNAWRWRTPRLVARLCGCNDQGEHLMTANPIVFEDVDFEGVDWLVEAPTAYKRGDRQAAMAAALISLAHTAEEGQ
jgi:hypothetical protein